MNSEDFFKTHEAITWQNCFNGELKHWRDRYFLSIFVAESGYLFFSWNGKVYQYDHKTGESFDTGILSKDLK